MVLPLRAPGPADDVAARISALLKAGLKQAVLFPLAVDDDASGAILRTIEALSCMTEALEPPLCRGPGDAGPLSRRGLSLDPDRQSDASRGLLRPVCGQTGRSAVPTGAPK